MKKDYTLTKLACYTNNITQGIVCNLPALLFITFHQQYGLSYTLLGSLILINFFTQLCIDLFLSFFSHKCNLPLLIKGIPLLTAIGFVLYALAPFLFPNAVFFGLVSGTVIFSCASGFSEVLISPVIASIPSDNPSREMSKLHSIYAWGSVFVILFSTVFLLIFGSKSWQILTLILSVIPIFAFLLFVSAPIPQMQTLQKVSGTLAFMKRKQVWLCVLAIFLGGAMEVTMAQWASGYLEQALQIPKIWGDIFGVAFFSVALGLSRTLYSKIGKNIGKVLFWGAIGASVCYAVAILSPFPILGLIACALTGFCVSMLWPGCLIVSAEKVPDGGVFMYAMMAAGGDLGSAIIPQTTGILTDGVMSTPFVLSLSQSLGLTIEQVSMRIGLSVGLLVSLFAIFLYWGIWKSMKN